MLISPIANFLATFGEEFGWRGYLLPKLLPLGGRNAVLLIGIIWGIWHRLFIFMGYEYGFKYPGYPWAGPLLFLWVTFGLGTFLAWLTLRSKSIWPAVIGHAAVNGIAAAAVLITTGPIHFWNLYRWGSSARWDLPWWQLQFSHRPKGWIRTRSSPNHLPVSIK